MSVAEQVELLTLEEYARLYDREGPFEIIDGQRRPLMPHVAIHGLIVRALFRLLDAICQKENLGEVVTEMPFVLSYDSKWVKGSRVPDLMFFAIARWSHYTATTPDWIHKPYLLVPDLAVEVVSHHDLYTELQDKVDHYLSDGVRLVWVVDPQRKRVMVYQGNQFMTLSENDTLTGSDVLPGLSIKLKELFQVVPAE